MEIKALVLGHAAVTEDMMVSKMKKLSLRNNKKGSIGVIVTLLIFALFLGALGPLIFQSLASFATNDNLSLAEKAFAAILGIVVMVILVVVLLRMAGINVNLNKGMR